jgi:putative flippase GtrA
MLVPQLSRYAVVSALALGLDFIVFLLLADALRPSLAGIAGYAAGMALHYCLAVRFVFDASASGQSEARLLAGFVASGAAGMGITATVIALATDLGGLPPAIGKALAVVISFSVVFIVRRSIVFARSTDRAALLSGARKAMGATTFTSAAYASAGQGGKK